MLTDPFTVGVQILNFLILVWLLRRLLYGPITRVMAERDARIQAQMEEARRLREEATAEGERHQALVAAFEAERDARLAAAREDLETWRHTHTQEVRAEVEALRRRWQDALQQEKRAFLDDLRRRAGREILAVTRSALRDLADVAVESRIVSRFLDQLGGIPPADRDALAAAALADGRQVHLRTAFPLPDAEQVRVTEAVGAALGPDLTVTAETAADLVGGIELRAGGLKVAWSIDDYLNSLEEALTEAFGADQEAGDDGDAGRPPAD
jgi:F-type H+-transporting ATPase subunit b